MSNKPNHRPGGIIHTYQAYNPGKFPSPTQPPPDLVSGAFEHYLSFGSMRSLTPEQLANIVKIDPSQIQGLGPSLESLMAMLLERRRKILEKYETNEVQKDARKDYRKLAKQVRPPAKLRKRFQQAIQDEQIYDLERLWYAADDDRSPFAGQLVSLIESLGNQYQVDELAAKYDFTGHEPMSVPEALVIKEELEKIDELLEQLKNAMENAQIGMIDMEALAEFAEPGEMSELDALRQMVEDYVREMAERQGLQEDGKGGFQLTPQAFRVFQGRLLNKIFSHLQASRTGRHQNDIVGEGAVELPSTKPYEFGDSITHMDVPQTFINAMIRSGKGLPIRLKPEDIEVHRTRNTPKCATAVIMDMSGSMRYEGQYINVKKMALALDGLIRGEYPGDFLQFIEMYTFAKLRRTGEIGELMPKPVTIHDPVVGIQVDMSNENISESRIHPHFTNIQHSLKLARQVLSNQDTPNRQVILITDGLPTSHFEDNSLFLLYPPHPRTEKATMREAVLCAQEGITINIFLIPSWSQSEEDIQFAYRLAETNKGRVFFTAGRDLDRYVVWDYVARKREILG